VEFGDAVDEHWRVGWYGGGMEEGPVERLSATVVRAGSLLED
jgi:hypothetical protein